MHISEYFNAKFRSFFGIIEYASFAYSKQFSSSVTETKRETIMFCSKVNTAGYSEIEKPNSLRQKTLSTCKVYANKIYRSRDIPL